MSLAVVRCLVDEKRVSVTLVFGYPRGHLFHFQKTTWLAGADMDLGFRVPTDDALIVTRT